MNQELIESLEHVAFDSNASGASVISEAIKYIQQLEGEVQRLERGLLRVAEDFYPDNDSEMALALGEMREAVRSLVTAACTGQEV